MKAATAEKVLLPPAWVTQSPTTEGHLDGTSVQVVLEGAKVPTFLLPALIPRLSWVLSLLPCSPGDASRCGISVVVPILQMRKLRLGKSNAPEESLPSVCPLVTPTGHPPACACRFDLSLGHTPDPTMPACVALPSLAGSHSFVSV